MVAILIDGKITYLYDNNDDKDTSSKIMPIIDEAFNVSKISFTCVCFKFYSY